MSQHREHLLKTGARALAMDPSVNLPEWRKCLPSNITVQGNLAPEMMTQAPAVAAEATQALLKGMAPWNRYIFNLGHGITPDARIETVETVLHCLDQATA